MLHKTGFERILLLAVIVLVLASSTGGYAQTTPPPAGPEPQGGSLTSGAPSAEMNAEVAAALAAVTPGLTYKSFSGLQFRPYSSEVSHAYNFYYGTAHIISPSFSGELLVPLDLPHGVDIREISVWFRDISVPNDIYFGLCQITNGDTAQGCNYLQVSMGANGNTGALTLRTLTGSPITTVDNVNKSYYLIAALYAADPQFGIVSVRVGYGKSSFLPAIRR